MEINENGEINIAFDCDKTISAFKDAVTSIIKGKLMEGESDNELWVTVGMFGNVQIPFIFLQNGENNTLIRINYGKRREQMNMGSYPDIEKNKTHITKILDETVKILELTK